MPGSGASAPPGSHRHEGWGPTDRRVHLVNPATFDLCVCAGQRGRMVRTQIESHKDTEAYAANMTRTQRERERNAGPADEQSRRRY